MSGRLRQTTAPSASWSARAALLPLPVLIVAAILHRLDAIDAVAMFASVGVALAIAVAAVVLGVVALVEIWNEGHGGVQPAMKGLVLGGIALLLPAVIAGAMLRFPPITDVSTDLVDPPLFAAAPDGIWNRPPPSAAEHARQAAAYPDIVARHYPVSPDRVYAETNTLFLARGWKTLDEEPPEGFDGIGWIEAEAKTLLFALDVDVVVRVLPDGRGSLVDMRSAWRAGGHDLGDNARRIRAFLADLDAALQGVIETAGDPDTTPLTDPETGELVPPLPAPAPSR